MKRTGIIILIGTAATILLLFIILMANGFFEQKRDLLVYFGFCATTTSIIVAILQSAKTHDWNRRNAGKMALREFREKIKSHSDVLNKHFNYFLRDENSPITKDEIHEKVCKKNATGSYDLCNISNKLKIDESKEFILEAIREHLNLYEDIASGVHQGVYDKEVVADLMASNIIKVANIFGPYINHFNSDMYPASKGRIWLNIKTLGEDYKKTYRTNNSSEERKKTG